jgi:hypothetical protein
MRKALLLMLTLVLPIASCSTVYYEAMEKVGIHKREILVDRVVDARDAQEEAKQQFSSALEQFSFVVNYDGGELQDKYEELNAAFEDSEEQANEVTARIEAVEHVSDALFDEWEAELDQYTNPKLRSASARQLKTTKARYRTMMKAMHSAESKMAPVLSAFRDQVLFLKHNLNAQAIISLKSEFRSIKSDIRKLIRDMETSINESNKFVEKLQQS